MTWQGLLAKREQSRGLEEQHGSVQPCRVVMTHRVGAALDTWAPTLGAQCAGVRLKIVRVGWWHA